MIIKCYDEQESIPTTTSSSTPMTTTPNVLTNAIKKHCNRVIIVGSHRCPACQSTLKEIAKRPDKDIFDFLDIQVSDLARELVRQFNIETIPKFIIVECEGNDGNGSGSSSSSTTIACTIKEDGKELDKCIEF